MASESANLTRLNSTREFLHPFINNLSESLWFLDLELTRVACLFLAESFTSQTKVMKTIKLDSC